MPAVEPSEWYGNCPHNTFQPAGMITQKRENVIDGSPAARASIVMVCGCGKVQHRWIPAPEEAPERMAEARMEALRQGRVMPHD